MKKELNFEVDPLMGKKVKDIVSGYDGLITGVVFSLTGCKQYVVKPQMKKDGIMREGIMLDENRVEILSNGIRPKTLPKKKTDKPGAMPMPDGFPKPI